LAFDENGQDLLKKMLEKNPAKRLSASAALMHPYLVNEDFN
jgi:serine/threonine protein kinase